MKDLVIKDLIVKVEDKQILNGVNLTIQKGDVLALLGPNGHGKSTLINVIMGNPRYEVVSGDIFYDGKSILSLSTDERSKLGIFMAFQNPPEVPGVEIMDFYKQMLNSHREKPISLFDFYNALETNYKKVELNQDMNTRHLNEGFSGGEKKRNEILQMLLLNPNFCMLDEIDSGLDVDAMKLIATQVNYQSQQGSTFLIISHYERLFSMVKPNKTAIMINGKIAVLGDASLVEKVDKNGYEWIKKEYGIEIKKEEKRPELVLGTCGNKKVK